MALKAGYYGVKKKILDELRKLDGILPAGVSKNNKLATQSEIDNIWTAQAVVGVKNLWPKYVGSSATPQNVTYTADGDGVVSCEGTSSAVATWRQGNLTLKAGKYKLYGGEGLGTYNSSSYNALVGLYNPSSSAYFAPDEGTTDTYTFETDTVVQPTLKVQSGVDASGYTFKPMIYFADDNNSVFVPNAMTNQELTASAADQKTAINAIIAAATDAADFAAFKTAMGAITPVTRSLSIQASETKSLDPEPEPETKTTKRSTKKIETTE